jgi:hypothetical protein
MPFISVYRLARNIFLGLHVAYFFVSNGSSNKSSISDWLANTFLFVAIFFGAFLTGLAVVKISMSASSNMSS